MSRPLRVGLNLVYLVEGSGGAGTYARELIPALLAVEPGTRITAFVGRSAPADVRLAPWASEVEWVTFPVDYDYGRPWNPLLAGAAQWGALPWGAARRRLDVVHGLANVVPIVSPRVARVVTPARPDLAALPDHDDPPGDVDDEADGAARAYARPTG